MAPRRAPASARGTALSRAFASRGEAPVEGTSPSSLWDRMPTWIRRLAAFAALLTVVLIVAGGLVTITDSGLACPDWPLCHGSPIPKMVGGVAVEHTHRLIATTVGLCTVALCLALVPWRRSTLLCGAILPAVLAGAIAGAYFRQHGGEFPAWATVLILAGFGGFAAVAAQENGPGRLATVALGLVVAQGLLGG